MTIKKILLLIIGYISLALGAIGAVLPLLPTVPFLLLAACCFARSSARLDSWFKQTKLYKNNLESYAKGQGMTRKTKAKITGSVTVLMAIGFAAMSAVPIGRIVLFFVWLAHMLYFLLVVKTLKD